MSKDYPDLTDRFTRQHAPDAGKLRRLLAKCGFELNVMAAGLFIAGIVVLAYTLYSVVKPG